MCLTDIAGPPPGSAKPRLAAPRQDSCPANKPHFVPVGKSGLSGKSLSLPGPGLGTRKLNKASSAGHDSWAQDPPPARRGEDCPEGGTLGPSLCPPPPEVLPPGSPSPALYWVLLCLRLHRGNWVGDGWSWVGQPHEWNLSRDAEDPQRAAAHPPCSQGPGTSHLGMNLGQS